MGIAFEPLKRPAVAENAPAFTIVASTKTKSILYAAFGVLQLLLAVYVAVVLLSASIFTTPPLSGAPTGAEPKTCLLYRDFGKSADLGACIWPAVVTISVGVFAIALAAYDVYSMQRLYPPRSRSNVLYQAVAAAVASVMTLAVGVQIAVGLQTTCNKFASLAWPCDTALSMLQSDWRLVAGGSAMSFVSCLLWGYYAYTEFVNFRSY